jgi:hypothetical protein
MNKSRALFVIVVILFCSPSYGEIRLTRNAGIDTITYSGEPWVNYEIQYTTNLIEGRWIHSKSIEADPEGSENIQVELFSDQPSLLYRVIPAQTYTNGLVVAIRDSDSPESQQIQVSMSKDTTIELLVFDLCFKRIDGKLQNIALDINLTGMSDPNKIFKDFKIHVAGLTYPSEPITNIKILESGSLGRLVFGNIDLELPAGAIIPFILEAQAIRGSDWGKDIVEICITLKANGSGGGSRNNPCVVDSNGHPIEVKTHSFSGGKLTLTRP